MDSTDRNERRRFINDLDEVIDTLWLFSTDDEDPWTVERVFQAIQPFGDAAIEGLVWAVQQDNFNLRLLGLRVLRECDPTAVVALPAVVAVPTNTDNS